MAQPQKQNTNDRGTLANSFKGFEQFVTAFKMFFHMNFILFGLMLMIQGLIIFTIYKIDNRIFVRKLTSKEICINKTFNSMWLSDLTNFSEKDYEIQYNCDGNSVTIKRSEFLKNFQDVHKEYIKPRILRNIFSVFLPTCLIYLLYRPMIRKFSKKHIEKTENKHLRGTKFIPQEEMKTHLQPFKDKGINLYRLNNYVSIPETIATRHNFVIGKPGSGKSQFMVRIVEQLLERNIKCIIHDFKGDFIPLFYDKNKHLIFNPVDARHMGLNLTGETRSDHNYSVFHPDKNKNRKINPRILRSPNDPVIEGWTLFNELDDMMDIDAFVASMIPEGKDPFWYIAPRDILKAALIYCIKQSEQTGDPKFKTNKAIYELLTLPPDDLRQRFESTDDCECGSMHLAEGKLAGQLMSVLSSSVSSLQYLIGSDGNFSIKKWVNGEQGQDKNVIFVANQAKVQSTLRTLIATFFDFSTKALCSLPDDLNRRLYFILDEFGQLSKIGSIVQLLTQSRSKGGAAFILIQDRAQIEAIYGQELSRSIVNSCGNKFYFAVGDESTAEFISKELGSEEIERTKESNSFGVSDLKDSISLNTETVERRVALPSEILNQKTLSCFSNMVDMPLTQIALDLIPMKNQVGVEGVILRDFAIKLSEEDKKREREKGEKEKAEKELEEAENDLDMLINNAPIVADSTPDDSDDEEPEDIDYNEINNSDSDENSEIIQENIENAVANKVGDIANHY